MTIYYIHGILVVVVVVYNFIHLVVLVHVLLKRM